MNGTAQHKAIFEKCCGIGSAAFQRIKKKILILKSKKNIVNKNNNKSLSFSQDENQLY